MKVMPGKRNPWKAKNYKNKDKKEPRTKFLR
jgi:hypothetical protein